MARKSPAPITSAPLDTATVKDFSGGWNTSDSELNVDSRYARIEDNLYYGTKGALSVRQGTELFADLADIVTGEFVDGYFFFAYVIAVASDGSIYAVDGAGVAARIWPKTGVSPWSDTEAVCFVEMNGTLIIHNGVNKPVQITSVLNINYLVDAATQTNINVPIGLVAAKHGDWHIIAQDSRLNVSHTRSPGTFAGDPPPNIADALELGSRVSRGNKEVNAMISYRDVLLVMFAQCIVPVSIAINEAGDALVFTVDDAIDNYGAFSHRVVQNLGDDALFCDIVGIRSVARTVFSKTLTPTYESQVISADIQRALNILSTDSLKKRVFSVFDANESAYMLFIPNDEDEAHSFERVCYQKVDQTKPKKVETWSRFRDWNWKFACRSAEGNIFFGVGPQIYILGREDVRTIPVDFKGDQETWDDDTTWNDHTGFTPISDFETSGLPIRFTREFPWSFMKKRENKKASKFLAIDTEGTAPFIMDMFVDYFYENPASVGELFTDDTTFDDGSGWESILLDLLPQLSTQFVGREAKNFGGQLFGNSLYGGGRSTAETRLYRWPAKFKLMKLRLHGEAKEPLRIVAVSLSYITGSIRRGG